MARERWRTVPGWRGYKVSSRGRVKSVPRTLADGREHGGGFLAPALDRDGYPYVTLRDGARSRRVGVAVLVLEVFDRPRPAGLEACHSLQATGRDDCRLEVLRWDTHRGNEKDKLRERSETAGAVSPPVTGVVPVTSGLR